MPNRLGILDVNCPVEWGHPLNRGLVGEWAVTTNAGWRGGLTLRDLVRGGHTPHDGTLTNGPTWAGPAGRPGGFGALSYDGFDDVTVTAALTSAAAVQSATAALWLYPRSVYSLMQPFRLDGSSGTFGFYTSNAAGNPAAWLWNNDGSDYAAATGLTVRANEWNFWAVAVAAAGVDVYLGNSTGLNSYHLSQSQSSHSLDGTVKIGAQNTASGAAVNGVIDDVALWVGRTLSAGEVAAFYDQTRRGNPDRWRWVSPRAWSFAAAAGGAVVPWWANRGSALGSGVAA